MRESQYTASVSKKLPPSVYAMKLSQRYIKGVPDSWYSGSAGDLWVEWKYFESIPRNVDLVGGSNPIITRLQQSWLRARHKHGRNVAVIVGTPNGGVIYDGISWDAVLTQDEFKSRLQDKKQLAAWITARVEA